MVVKIALRKIALRKAPATDEEFCRAGCRGSFLNQRPLTIDAALAPLTCAGTEPHSGNVAVASFSNCVSASRHD